MGIFFFKQKTAYDIEYGLVGSEMCIRDSLYAEVNRVCGRDDIQGVVGEQFALKKLAVKSVYICLLYTSDAADERSSVDLGGRRIIKKKTKQKDGGTIWHVKQNNHHNTAQLDT